MKQKATVDVGPYRSIYSIVDHIRERGLVLYGAGFIGEIAFRIFSLFQIRPECFCDDDPKKQGTDFECCGVSVPIISLDEAAQRFPDAVYILSVGSDQKQDRPRDVMKDRLKKRKLFDENSRFYPEKYIFLLEGGFEALGEPLVPDESSFTPERISNMVIFSSMGHSGTVFFSNLMDGHPNILNIWLFGESFNLKRRYLEQLQYLEDDELVVEIARWMTPHFISHINPSSWGSRGFLTREGKAESNIYISPSKFIANLSSMLVGRGHVSGTVLCKAIFAAYHNTIGKPYIPNQDYWIFYETHEADCNTCVLDGVISPEDLKRLEYWVIIREPVQHVFSYERMRHQYLVVENKQGNGAWVQMQSQFIRGSLGVGLEKGERNQGKIVKVIRFEDVKLRTRETMRAVCDWMDIPFNESMLATTVNGIEIYFGSATGDVISAQNTVAVERHDFSEFLSAYDVFRLNLACQNVQRAYGYACDMPDYHSFSQAFLQELYQQPFRYDSWMDPKYKEAQELGYVPQDDKRLSEHITEMILDYFKQGSHELITDMLRPEGNA